ncbi:MAG TPA: HD domain-containing protein [Thermoleophilaceae bacterium]|nr:HD domain-containing protein [Thermoleophilaceae bacterium]
MSHTLASQYGRPGFLERSPCTRAALDYADERHAGQRREADGAPFVLHPLEVARLLHDCGYPDHVIAAGVLHDVIEDTDAKRDDLEQRFGRQVAELVAALTDDPTIEDQAERKAALRVQVARAGEEAAVVFAADKVSKARELRMRAGQAALDERAATKLEHYEQSLEMLSELLPGHALVEQLRSELRH